jgi:membrane protein required for colicin V production
MNWLDVVLALILLASMVDGFSKGLTRHLIGLITLVAAILLAIWFYPAVAAWLAPYLSSRALAAMAGFLAVFVGVNVLGSFAGAVLARVLKVTGLSFFDHVLGAGFGVVRAVLVAIVLVMAIMAFSPGDKPPSSVVHSRFAPYVVDASRLVTSLAPAELKEGFRKSYEQVKRAWEEALKKGILAPEAKHEREI